MRSPKIQNHLRSGPRPTSRIVLCSCLVSAFALTTSSLVFQISVFEHIPERFSEKRGINCKFALTCECFSFHSLFYKMMNITTVDKKGKRYYFFLTWVLLNQIDLKIETHGFCGEISEEHNGWLERHLVGEDRQQSVCYCVMNRQLQQKSQLSRITARQLGCKISLLLPWYLLTVTTTYVTRTVYKVHFTSRLQFT